MFPGLCNPSRQPFQFLAVYDFVVDHSGEELLDRTSTKPVNDLLNGAYRNTLARLSAAIEVGASINIMLEITLLFQTAKDGASGRFLHRPFAGKRLPNNLGAARSVRPYKIHDEVFQFAEWFRRV